MAAPHQEPHNQADLIERRKKAIELRRAGYTYKAIADELGYYDKGHAHNDIAKAIRQAQADLSEDAAEYRKAQTVELEAMQAVAWEALSSMGVHISTTEDGDVITTEVDDPELALKGLDRLVKIQARLAALNGLDAPAKIDTTATVKYIVEGVNTDKMA